MGLIDVAGLFTGDPRTQKNIVDLLMIMGDREMTFQELLDDCGFNERYLRFLITKLRSFRLIRGRRWGMDYYYYLSYDGFSTFLKSKFSDAIYNLTKRTLLKRKRR